jgi:hypothetical protein
MSLCRDSTRNGHYAVATCARDGVSWLDPQCSWRPGLDLNQDMEQFPAPASPFRHRAATHRYHKRHASFSRISSQYALR